MLKKKHLKDGIIQTGKMRLYEMHDNSNPLYEVTVVGSESTNSSPDFEDELEFEYGDQHPLFTRFEFESPKSDSGQLSISKRCNLKNRICRKNSILSHPRKQALSLSLYDLKDHWNDVPCTDTHHDHIYEEIDDYLYNHLCRPTPTLETSRSLGTLEVQWSMSRNDVNSEFRYDKLIRKGSESNTSAFDIGSASSQSTLFSYVNNSTTLLGDQRLPSVMDMVPATTSLSTESGRTFVLYSPDSIPEYKLSEKLTRLARQTAQWTCSESVFLSFYVEEMSKLHNLKDEEECSEIISHAMGTFPTSSDVKLPRCLIRRVRRIKKALFNTCGFSLQVGIVPLLIEKKPRRSITRSFKPEKDDDETYVILKMLFRVPTRTGEMKLIDMKGRMYSDMMDWEENNELYNIVSITYPRNGELVLDSDGDLDLIMYKPRTKQRVMKQVADVSMGIGAVSAAVVGAAGLTTVTAPVIIPAIVVGEAIVVIYAGVRGIMTYREKRKHRATCPKDTS